MDSPDHCVDGRMESPIECRRIPAGKMPGATPFYTSFLTNFSRVSGFYRHTPDAEGIRKAAGEIQLEKSVRTGVVDVLRAQNRSFGGDAATEQNLDRLRDGAFAVVTGQQVGLFSGPAYTVYKALTAIRLAKELTGGGINAVPVFWLATEDHDLEEVNHTEFGKRGDVERFELVTSDIPDRRVGEIRLGNAISEIVALGAKAFSGSFTEEVESWLRECYTPGETFGTSFGKLMTRIFAGRGLIFLDPLSPELHRLAAPVLLKALREHRSLAHDLVARTAALEQAGFHAQVKVAEETTLLFRIVERRRTALRPANGGFAAGEKKESESETLSALEQHPEEFSPNALLRPVMQDALLPTVAYIGGAAEVAYQAQASILYDRLLGRAPAILPRAGFTLVPPYARNQLKKYNLEITDVFAGRSNLRARMESEALPEALTSRFEQGEKAIRSALEQLREPISRLDKTLGGALDTATEKMLYQFTGLRTKAGRAEGFRTGVLNSHEAEIASALYPGNALQERTLCFLPFLASEGGALLDHLESLIHPGTGEHVVVDLESGVK